ncbi:MAG: hypothetical protein HY289_04490 [Planctomycetes bacterium]|nr:hypothetical protein [Planctomycetota bacterium]
MAKKSKPPENIGQVRIPGGFLYCLDDLVNELHRQIGNQAAALAFDRKRGAHVGVVVAADMVKATKMLLPWALAEFEEKLTSPEIHHAREHAA